MGLRKTYYSICTLFFLSISSPLLADEWINDDNVYCPVECCEIEKIRPHRLSIGPEVYQVKRTREGGTRQDGVLGGGRIDYDYIKGKSFYFGAEGSYAVGELTGKTGNGRDIKSRFSDAYVEGRAGYTFQLKCAPCFTFSPFIGAGYLRELNCFIKPSPLPIHYQIKTTLAIAGFLSNLNFRTNWNAGVNFKAKMMINGKNTITNDPNYDSLSISIKNQMQYRVELPLAYQYRHSFLRVTPFYEARHYGRQVYYPFDFLETKLKLVGAIFDYVYSF